MHYTTGEVWCIRLVGFAVHVCIFRGPSEPVSSRKMVGSIDRFAVLQSQGLDVIGQLCAYAPGVPHLPPAMTSTSVLLLLDAFIFKRRGRADPALMYFGYDHVLPARNTVRSQHAHVSVLNRKKGSVLCSLPAYQPI